MQESELLEGQLEPTNEWYAIAKIAGIKLCQAYRKQFGLNFISANPCNLYGPGDNYHPGYSHALASLIRKFCEAVEHNIDTVEIWGTGKQFREFLHVDDCADGLVFLMKYYNGYDCINLGSGKDLTIRELAEMIANKSGYSKGYKFDTTRPDGTPRKLMDSSKINKLGWKPQIPLSEGIKETIKEYQRIKDL